VSVSALLTLAACNTDPVQVKVPDVTSNQINATGTTGFVQGDAPAPVDTACVTQTTAAERRQVSMYMMLDSSGSMLDSTGTLRTKWDSVTRAIRGFLSETSDSDLQVGLQFFPLAKPGSRFNCSVESDCGPDSDGDGVSDGGPCFLKTCRASDQIQLCVTSDDCPGGPLANPCLPFGLCSGSDPQNPVACELLPGVAPALCSGGTLGVCSDFDRPCTNAASCDPTAYAKPAVEIGLVSQNLAAVDQALKVQIPQGLTPTVPALQGAIEHARSWGKAHPDQTVVVLLATDGLPTQCGKDAANLGQGTPEPIADVLNVAASGVNGEIPVRTFVVGVFQPGDTSSVANVNQIAKAGGTDQAAFIDSSADVDQQFLDALRAIESGQLGCEFQLPASNAPLDYFKVNLQFSDASTSQQLPYVRDRAGCDANPAGWHYDVDPNQSTPSSIQVCPNVCTQIKAATAAKIQLQLGCTTVIR
jgi:Mg-chelatase subunit ChlD